MQFVPERLAIGVHRVGFVAGAVALACAAFGEAQEGGQDEQSPPPIVIDPAQESDTPPKLPDALRNPRALRLEQGMIPGPRMVAGAISITGEAPIDYYTRLEPIIGEFTFTGSQLMRPDGEPVQFEGVWTNRWVLDGVYLESSFTLNDRTGTPYQVLGLTWYDEEDHRYEAHFFNSTSPNQTVRWGNFDDAVEAGASGASTNGDAPAPESSGADDASAEGPPTLTMLGRNANQPETIEPISKFELVIVSVNEFKYVGYSRPRDGTGDWRKTFEMTMTRIEPIALGDGG